MDKPRPTVFCMKRDVAMSQHLYMVGSDWVMPRHRAILSSMPNGFWVPSHVEYRYHHSDIFQLKFANTIIGKHSYLRLHFTMLLGIIFRMK